MQYILPRGIRNNNPGNIRIGNNNWQGMKKTGFDPNFVEFENPVYGLRALMKILLTYYSKYGLDTVQSIVNRWAPPHENATDSYAAHVAKILKVKRFEIIDVPKQLIPLAKAITVHENGYPKKNTIYSKYWYSDNIYKQAYFMATGKLSDNYEVKQLALSY